MERDSIGMHAFADEYGDADLALDRPGGNSFFIVTAVLVADDQIEQVRTRARAIRGEFFGAGEMRSTSVGPDDVRRKALLRALGGLPLTSYSLAVDKRELDREGGLAHRSSFFKYAHRRLYERIYKLFYQVKLVVDEYGDEGFMKTFLEFVDKRLPLTLFTRRDFVLAKSADEVMLQVADVISGSLARVLEPRRPSQDANAILAAINERSVGIEVWPPRILPEVAEGGAGAEGRLNEPPDAARDELIRGHCLRQAQAFLRRHPPVADPGDELRAQSEVLHILLFQVQFADASKYVPTGRLLEKLAAQTGIALTPRRLRTVIAGLRDAGVVIARSAQGYKIPVGERDVAEFVAHANTIVPPMLERVRHARRDLLAASDGAIDILAPARFALLRTLIEVQEAHGAASQGSPPPATGGPARPRPPRP
jgi:hypothetical protein